jgi:hypothetical protein
MVLGLIFWILPILSLYANGVVYAATLGAITYLPVIVGVLLSAAFIIIGNYLPKTKRNRTIGIKIKWTLESDDNWYATHRFAGKIWVICGIVMLVCSFLPEKIFFIPMLLMLLPMAIAPAVYSYLFYKKQVREGSFKKAEGEGEASGKKSALISIVMLAVVGVIVVVLLLGGGFEVALDEDSISVDANFSGDIDIKYSDIDRLEYRETDDAGHRVSGYGGAKLLMGHFQNDEFGNYTRYSHGTANGCVVIKSGEKIYVIGCEDKAATKALYENLMDKIGE